MIRPLAVALSLALAMPVAQAADWTLINVVETPATTTDALPLRKGVANSANLNRFGFYSDLVFDKKTGDWFALADRGPGGGLIDYATRVERIRVTWPSGKVDAVAAVDANQVVTISEGRGVTRTAPMARRAPRP